MAFNEVGGLAQVARELHDELDQLGCSHEILVVDDGSGDGTGGLADELAQTVPGLRVCHHRRNLGLGAEYRTGFAEARGE